MMRELQGLGFRLFALPDDRLAAELERGFFVCTSTWTVDWRPDRGAIADMDVSIAGVCL